MSLAGCADVNDDVKSFLQWVKSNAATSCGTNYNDQNLQAECSANHDDPPKPTTQGYWAGMCEAVATTVKCANVPSDKNSDVGTELYKEFKTCCEGCGTQDSARDCCAACPNPIDYFLFWAENNASTEVCGDQESWDKCVKPAKLGGTVAKGTSYAEMCTTLKTNVGCSELKAENFDKSPYTDFQECAKECKTKDVNNVAPNADQQMQCVAESDCGAPPTTHTTGHTTEKQTTAGPAPPAPPPAPTTTATVIPKTTTETEGEDSDGNGTGPTDTSAPLLPPTAIWAKVIALTAMIAKLI